MNKRPVILIIGIILTVYFLIFSIMRPGSNFVSEYSKEIEFNEISLIPNPYLINAPRPNIPVTIYLNISSTFQPASACLCWKSTYINKTTWLNISMEFNETHCYANIDALPENNMIWFKIYAKNYDDRWLENNNSGSFFYYYFYNDYSSKPAFELLLSFYFILLILYIIVIAYYKRYMNKTSYFYERADLEQWLD